MEFMKTRPAASMIMNSIAKRRRARRIWTCSRSTGESPVPFNRIPRKDGNGRDETSRGGRGGDALAFPAIDDAGFGSKIASDRENRQAAGQADRQASYRKEGKQRAILWFHARPGPPAVKRRPFSLQLFGKQERKRPQEMAPEPAFCFISTFFMSHGGRHLVHITQDGVPDLPAEAEVQDPLSELIHGHISSTRMGCASPHRASWTRLALKRDLLPSGVSL